MKLFQPNRKPLSEITRKMAFVARGVEKADTVVKNGKLLNVNTAEILDGIDIAITEGRIALVGKADHCIGPDTEVIDATGAFLAPGFLDGHIHVESSMITVTEYAKAVIPHGTTGIFCDCHEIVNVLGMPGLKAFVDEGQNLPLKVMTVMPSCVPSLPGFEDAGGFVGPDEVKEAMTWDGIYGLGEMMNYPGVLFGSDSVHGILRETLRSGKVATGHYGDPDIDVGLQAFVAAGITACHESVSKDQSLARMRLGCYAQLREGSAWHDLKETVRAVTENNIDSRFVNLISDDVTPATLVNEGHLDLIVKRAIGFGMRPIEAVQAVTINVAQNFERAREIGTLSPGRCADIVFISDLAECKVERVMCDGVVVAEQGKMVVELSKFEYPEFMTHSIKIDKPLVADDFKILIASSGNGKKTATVRVIESVELKVWTLAKTAELPIEDGEIRASVEQNIAKCAVIERYHGGKTKGLGFVGGYGFKGGAVASTVAHDSHNLMIMGMNDEDMALAGNELIERGGGMIAVRDGKVLAVVPMPIAGLLSTKPVAEVAAEVEKLEQTWRDLGCTWESPFMTFALVPLIVLPELRLSNRGLVDTVKFDYTDLIVQ
jgi:adenine deaminase